MEIKYEPTLQCLGCDKPLHLDWRDTDVYEAQCHECKALYRLRVATYRQAEQ